MGSDGTGVSVETSGLEYVNVLCDGRADAHGVVAAVPYEPKNASAIQFDSNEQKPVGGWFRPTFFFLQWLGRLGRAARLRAWQCEQGGGGFTRRGGQSWDKTSNDFLGQAGLHSKKNGTVVYCRLAACDG